jgi:hypothetical protein
MVVGTVVGRVEVSVVIVDEDMGDVVGEVDGEDEDNEEEVGSVDGEVVEGVVVAGDELLIEELVDVGLLVGSVETSVEDQAMT